MANSKEHSLGDQVHPEPEQQLGSQTFDHEHLQHSYSSTRNLINNSPIIFQRADDNQIFQNSNQLLAQEESSGVRVTVEVVEPTHNNGIGNIN